MNHWQKKELFHVKHYSKPLVSLPRAGKDKQIPTSETATTPNARLNHRREAAGFILRMFQLHEHRPREVDSMFRSSDLQSAKAREESEPVFDTSPRVPRIHAQRAEPSH